MDSEKRMKLMTVVFSLAVLGVVFSLGMSIYTAVRIHRETIKPVLPGSIAVPAY
jgi:hypothetical protein